MEVMINVLYHSKASATDKVVLLGIANHHGDGGAWPSLETLGRYANVSERQVSRSIKTLEELGELSVDHNRGLNVGRNKTNRYWINLTCPPECDGTMNHRIDGQTHLTRRVDTSDIDGQTDMSGEPAIEPVKKPIAKNTKIPSDFAPTLEMLNWVKEQKYDIDPGQQTLLFIDYYEATGRTMKKWDYAWKNWIRRAVEYQKKPWDKAAEVAVIESKRKLDVDKEHTRKLLEESQMAAQQATPPPKCEHGKTLVRCVTCVSRLS
jgi:hypothetical protein